MEIAITAQIQKYRNTYISIIKEKRREVSMNIKQIKENKKRMILQFSIPSIIAMLLQTVITITDGYFTGNYVGQNALAAINLGLPNREPMPAAIMTKVVFIFFSLSPFFLYLHILIIYRLSYNLSSH